MILSVTPSCSPENRNRIKKLSPLLINQLAAGEVVTRPASVVKELVENAIDAGATEVSIRITQGGMGSIEVSDNGCGIHADDMAMAVTRFATSKIADVAQLQGIATLGFRGEALAATAAVSRLTLKSSCDNSGIGRQLVVAGILEDSPKLVPVVQPQGTTVIVKDLYFNVPARRGNLKSIATEFAHIETVVKQLALVASDVTIELWHNDKRRYHFAAIDHNHGYANLPLGVDDSGAELMPIGLARLRMIVPSLADRSGLPDFVDPDFVDDVNQLCVQPLTISLAGLIAGSSSVKTDGLTIASFKSDNSRPLNQSNVPDANTGIYGFLLPCLQPSVMVYKLIYINGRLVKDKHIAQSLRASASTVTALSDLGYVLFFQLPQTWLNVNVHPSKQCIKIQDLANISAHLEMGVKSSLQAWQKQLPDLTVLESSQSVSPLVSSSPTLSSSTLSSPTLTSKQLARLTPFNTGYAVNEPQQIYRSQKQPPNFLSSRLRADFVANNAVMNPTVIKDLVTIDATDATDATRPTMDDNISQIGQISQKMFVKPQASIDPLVCLYRISTSALNRINLMAMPNSNSKAQAKFETQIESETDLEKVVILVQWQAAFYLFDEQTLVKAAATDIDEQVVPGLLDNMHLDGLTAQLTASIAAMSAAERAAFAKTAVYTLSLPQLTAFMLQQGL